MSRSHLWAHFPKFLNTFFRIDDSNSGGMIEARWALHNSRHGLVLISISQARKSQSNMKSKPNISKHPGTRRGFNLPRPALNAVSMCFLICAVRSS